MKTSTAVIADVAIGAFAGIAASKATEYVQTLLYSDTEIERSRFGLEILRR